MVEPFDKVLQDLDWRTLLFLTSIFLMIEAFTRSSLLQSLAKNRNILFEAQLVMVTMMLVTRIGVASSDLTDIRVMVVAVVLLVKGDLVAPELVPEFALGAACVGSPAFRLLVFVAKMFGGTVGGMQRSLASRPRLSGWGICTAQGRPLTFGTFAR